MSFKQFLAHNWRLVSQNNLFVNRYANPVLESHNAGFSQQAVDNTIEIPLKPKKPNPPFFKFLHEKRPELLEKHNLNVKDAARVLSELWKNFDVNTKTKMNEIYNKELKEYKESIKVYKEKLTEDQKDELFRMKYEQSEQKAKRKLKKELKELGKPRRPLTGYLMFVSDEIKNHGDVPVHKYMMTIANKWKEMDVRDKEKYIKAAAEEYDKYNTEILKWENDMIKAGRYDLVRSRPISNNITDNN